MAYPLSPTSEIQSSSQRQLATEWVRACGSAPLPRLADCSAAFTTCNETQLVIWAVEGEGRLMQFRALYQGQAVEQAFNADWVGKTLAEVIPISLRRFALDAAKDCVAGRLPVYTIISTIDSGGRQVSCERLLMPFGLAARVQHVVSCLQLTQVPGGIRRNKIVRDFEFLAKLTVAVRISRSCPEAGRRSTAIKGGNRVSRRRVVKKAARITWGRHGKTCVVRNLSATGALLEGADLQDVPGTFRLTVEMETKSRRCAVAWRKKTRIGVRFG